MTSESADILHMSRALALAERGRGRTSPNPMVGAVIVDGEGVVVGRGSHEVAGGPHAEVRALNDAAERARGGTLYCTLEPCCHTGRTGPCAPLVVSAGIRRVVIAVEDPNPLVAGKGIAHLRAQNIEVALGVLAADAERLNRPFFTLMRRGRPFVTMKTALSLDGYVAARPGERTRLTGSAANRLIHRDRAEVDALAIGSGTLLADDPLLTPRGAFRSRPLVRLVFDGRLRTPPTARLLSTLDTGPVIIMTTDAAAGSAPERAQALTDAGVHLEILATDTAGRLPIREALGRLGEQHVTSVMFEGGPALHRAIWEARVVDRVQLFVAPDALGPGGVPWLPQDVLSFADLSDVSATPVGRDIMLEAHVHGPD
jgi:diaminohydroxyphosphoribosylaminopyrimidine deaminase / 5-amino-6-(5-phosphoribosylamino)uracil reductase